MTLRSLLIFVTVAETKNMTKAADKLIITQSSISQVISEIEKEYNVVLFERVKNGLSLTASGEDMLKYAKEILSKYDELESVLHDNSTNAKIRIGASTTVGTSFLRRAINEIKKWNPNLSYTVLVDNSKNIENAILENRIDIAVVEGNIKAKGIEVEAIGKDKMVFICSPEHHFYGRNKISLKELDAEPLVLREEGSGTRIQLLEQLENKGIRPNVEWTCSSNRAIINAVRENFGVSVLPTLVVFEELQNGMLWSCSIEDADLTREYKIVYHENKYFTASMKKFAELAKTIAKEISLGKISFRER